METNTVSKNKEEKPIKPNKKKVTPNQDSRITKVVETRKPLKALNKDGIVKTKYVAPRKPSKAPDLKSRAMQFLKRFDLGNLRKA